MGDWLARSRDFGELIESMTISPIKTTMQPTIAMTVIENLGVCFGSSFGLETLGATGLLATGGLAGGLTFVEAGRGAVTDTGGIKSMA